MMCRALQCAAPPSEARVTRPHRQLLGGKVACAGGAGGGRGCSIRAVCCSRKGGAGRQGAARHTGARSGDEGSRVPEWPPPPQTPVQLPLPLQACGWQAAERRVVTGSGTRAAAAACGAGAREGFRSCEPHAPHLQALLGIAKVHAKEVGFLGYQIRLGGESGASALLGIGGSTKRAIGQMQERWPPPDQPLSFLVRGQLPTADCGRDVDAAAHLELILVHAGVVLEACEEAARHRRCAAAM
jgi:hypothetical protein